MDGRELVYDRGALPENAVLPSRPAKSQWRSFAVLPIGGVTLGATLFLFDHVLTHQPTPQNAAHSSVEKAAHSSVEVAAGPRPEQNPVPAPHAAAALPSPAQPPIIKVKATNRAPAAARPSPTPPPSPTPQREEKKPKPENGNTKKESKLGSIMKKTGRILKKPFGF